MFTILVVLIVVLALLIRLLYLARHFLGEERASEIAGLLAGFMLFTLAALALSLWGSV